MYINPSRFLQARSGLEVVVKQAFIVKLDLGLAAFVHGHLRAIDRERGW